MTATRFCNGVTRRDFIHLGTASLFGLGLNVPTLVRAQERAQRASGVSRGSPNDVSLIFLFLHGGLSTIDSWDMKPNAPQEFRGEFRQIPTNVTGIQVCEHLPRSSQHMDKFSLI